MSVCACMCVCTGMVGTLYAVQQAERCCVLWMKRRDRPTAWRCVCVHVCVCMDVCMDVCV